MEEPFPQPARGSALVIVADDYGYCASYDRGIVEAAAAGAVDAVDAMVGEGRRPDPDPLLASAVEIGLHLELPWLGPIRHATDADRERAVRDLERQLGRFDELFGRQPGFLNGHHHCHAAPGLAAAIARIARERGLSVRSVSPRHRRLLRCVDVGTPDRLLGRYDEVEPAMPPELRSLVDGGAPPPGVSEWMVHPGYRDPACGSSYDAGREEDLRLLAELRSQEPLRGLRRSVDRAL